MASVSSKMCLTDLPIEILLQIGEYLYCDFRLGWPTRGFTRRLLEVFRTPSNIVARALARPVHLHVETFVQECWRSEADHQQIIDGMLGRMTTTLDSPPYNPNYLFTAKCRVPGRRGHATAIEAAVYTKKVDVLRSLFKLLAEVKQSWKKAPPYSPYTGFFSTELAWACYMGYVEIARVLLENGASVYADGLKCPGNVLRESVATGKPEIVELLLDHNAESSDALWQAVKYGRVKMVRLLLTKRPNDWVSSNAREPALLHAQTMGYTEILELIRNHSFGRPVKPSDAV
ncbi:hypothetical protein HDU93_008683 [Gonapodya sp. JEL0774]|nr:hypothetical protein HDU93_008683 [Gonapodya sp. JEL0774]